MERTIKIDLLSFAISVSIHVAIFSTSLIPKVLLTKTYQVLDVLPITFDTEVDSNLLAERSLRGEKGTVSLKRSSSLQSGKRSEGSRPLQHHVKIARERGLTETSTSYGSVTYPTSIYKFSTTTGNGKTRLSISYDSIEDKHGKKLTAIRSDLLVPYLIKVRDRIMANWKLPYIGNLKDGRVVIYLTIDRGGKLNGINVEKFSSNMAFNRSVISAIYSSEPFSPIPKRAKINRVRLKVNFEVK